MTTGIWQLIPSPILTSVLLSRGLDFVIADFEHGSFGIESLMLSVFAAKALNKKIYVRVEDTTSSLVTQILDCNVDGILFAHIESLEDALSASMCMNCPPNGNRSYTPFSYAHLYNHPNYDFSIPRLGILIESLDGISSLADILTSVNSIHFVYFGAYDLSVQIGYPGEIFHSEILSLLTSVAKDCDQAGIALWALAQKDEDIDIVKSCGVNVIVRGVDTGLISDAVSFGALL
jgi:4-hydroxy-2-oxoheptanedioate aldolase